MSFYLSKSIKVGALRFNLSKSGVGVSTGIRGLRFGTGPRGNYVHMGRHGVYYRATLAPSSARHVQPADQPQQELPSGTHDPLQEIESADVSKIVDSSSQELLDELNKKQRLKVLWPFVLGAMTVSLVGGVLGGWPSWALVLIVLAGILLSFLAYQRDLLRKTVVLFYDLDSSIEQAYGLLHQWASQVAACSRVWHIEAEGRVRDRKYHAGASSLVRRKPTFAKKAHPPFVKTNIETVAIGVGRQVLHFFPDRLLVYDSAGVGAVGYKSLELQVAAQRFIESEGVPRDAKVVDRTWRYVNKRGGPDRRFKDNTELPICLYGELSLQSASGLNEVVQVSNPDVLEGFVAAVRHLASMQGPDLEQLDT